jgi:hypothetical protein
MHELIVHDWLDHDYIARHVDGWPALRERALEWPPERVAGVCGITADEVRELARDYGHDPAGDPPELRHAAGARRRQCGAPDRDAALPGRCLAPPRGGLLLSSSGWFRGGNDAVRCSGPICWPARRARAPST